MIAYCSSLAKGTTSIDWAASNTRSYTATITTTGGDWDYIAEAVYVTTTETLDEGTTDDEAKQAAEPRPVQAACKHYRALAGIGSGITNNAPEAEPLRSQPSGYG